MPREKQIEFPPEQSPVKWLTPVLLLLAGRLHRCDYHHSPRSPERGLHRPLVAEAQ